MSLLHSLPSIEPLKNEDVLFFVEKNHLSGKGVGWVDVHLLASSKLANIPIWTNDKKLGKVAEKLNLAYS